MEEFDLPAEIEPLLAARDRLRERYASSGLRFTLDGNLVGDIGEAIAAELFGIELSARCGSAVDGFTKGPNRKSVQVKASGTFREACPGDYAGQLGRPASGTPGLPPKGQCHC